MKQHAYIRHLVVWVLAALAVAGCGGGGGAAGGGGGGGGGTLLTPVKVAAKLPTGFGVPVTQLTLSEAMAAPVPFDASGSATVNIFSTGRHLAAALDSSGNPVLMGFVGPDHPQLDTQSTAVAMLYFTIGGYLAPVDNQKVLIDSLEHDPNIATLAAAIDTALKADPKALVSPTAAFRAPITSVARVLLARSNKQGAAIIDPYPAEKSGATVQYGSDKNQITAKNRYRRRALLLVDQVATVDNAGIETANFKPIGMAELKPARGTVYTTDMMGNLGGLSEETVSDPVTVPDPTGAVDKLKLKAAVIGPGSGAGATYSLTPTQQTAYSKLLKKSFYGDFLLGVLNKVLCNTTLEGMGAQQQRSMYALMQQTVEDQQDSIIPFVEGAFPSVEARMVAGDLKGTLADSIDRIWGDTATQNKVAQFYVDFMKKVPDFPLKPDTSNIGKVLAWLNKVMNLHSVSSVVSDALNDLPQGRDWSSSNRTELWDIETNKVSVTFTPKSSKVDARGANSSVKLTAKASGLTGVPANAISYRYTTKGQHGTLRNNTAGDVLSVEGPDDFVYYNSRVGLDASFGSDEVAVEVFVDRGSGQKEKVGSAKVTVEVVAKSDIELTPKVQSIKKNETSRAIVAKTLYPNLLSEGKLKLRWKLDKGLGTLSVQTGQLTSTQSVTFKAGGTEGTETVSCEVVDAATNEVMSTATASVKIEARTSIIFGSIRYYGHFKVENGWFESGSGIGFTVPKVQGAKSYSIHCYNFNDTAYYGTSIYRSCDANGNGADFDVDANDFSLTTKGADGDFDFGLTGGVGWGPWGGGTDYPDMRADAYKSSWRFAGMIIEVTVTY